MQVFRFSTQILRAIDKLASDIIISFNLQAPVDPAGKRHFQDLHKSFSGQNLNLYDTVTSTEGDLNSHQESQAKVPNWAKWSPFKGPLGQPEDLPAANQLVRSHLHPRIRDEQKAKKCVTISRSVLFELA